MKFHPIILALAIVLGIQHQGIAQNQIDTTIREQRLEFFQVYKPEIEQPRKMEVQAQLPNIKPTLPAFHYVVPQQTLSYTFNSVPIRPLALGRMEKEIDFQNYIQLGLGNKRGAYVDLGLASIRDKDYEATVHVKHFSQTDKDYFVSQNQSNTEVDIGGVYHFDEHDFAAQLFYHRKGMSYMPSIFPVVNTDRYKQAYSNIGLKVSMKNTAPIIEGLSYAPELKFDTYRDKFKNFETNFDFNIPVSYQIIEGLSAHLALEGLFTSLETPIWSISNNLFSIQPSLKYSNKNVRLKAGIANVYGKRDQAYWLPDLYAQFFILNDGLKIDLGWKSSVIRNTFKELSTINPFVFSQSRIQQTKSDQVFVGFESRLGTHLSFGAQLSWRQWLDMPMFNAMEQTEYQYLVFEPQYLSKVQAANPEAFIQYDLGPNFGVKGYLSYFNYNVTEGIDRILHMPKFKTGGQIRMKFFKRLLIEGQADFWNGIYAQTLFGEEVKLKPFLDLQVRGDFTITPRWSAFVSVNNILNQTYQRWYDYDHFGINFIGGVRFKF